MRRSLTPPYNRTKKHYQTVDMTINKNITRNPNPTTIIKIEIETYFGTTHLLVQQ